MKTRTKTVMQIISITLIGMMLFKEGSCLPRILFSEFKSSERYGPLVINTFKSREFEFEDIPNLEYIADDPGDYINAEDYVMDPMFSTLPDQTSKVFSLRLYKGADVLTGNYRFKNLAPEYFTINVDNQSFSQWLVSASKEIKLFQQGIIKTFRPKVIHLDLVTQPPQTVNSLGFKNDEELKKEFVDVLRGFELMNNTYLTYLESGDTQSRNRLSNVLSGDKSVKLNGKLKVPGKPLVNVGELNCPVKDFHDNLTKYLNGIVNKLKSQNIVP